MKKILLIDADLHLPFHMGHVLDALSNVRNAIGIATAAGVPDPIGAAIAQHPNDSALVDAVMAQMAVEAAAMEGEASACKAAWDAGDRSQPVFNQYRHHFDEYGNRKSKPRTEHLLTVAVDRIIHQHIAPGEADRRPPDDPDHIRAVFVQAAASLASLAGTVYEYKGDDIQPHIERAKRGTDEAVAVVWGGDYEQRHRCADSDACGWVGHQPNSDGTCPRCLAPGALPVSLDHAPLPLELFPPNAEDASDQLAQVASMVGMSKDALIDAVKGALAGS